MVTATFDETRTHSLSHQLCSRAFYSFFPFVDVFTGEFCVECMMVLVVRQTVWRRHKPIGNGNYAAVAAAAAAEAAKLLLFDSINGRTTWWNARRNKMLRIIKWNRKHAHTQERDGGCGEWKRMIFEPTVECTWCGAVCKARFCEYINRLRLWCNCVWPREWLGRGWE